MNPETMLLGMIPDNVERISQELFRYTLTAARVTFTTMENRRVSKLKKSGETNQLDMQ